jgi:peptidoglycan/xylan/chitin deacetylase (PgdA/CDA1 family)
MGKLLILFLFIASSCFSQTYKYEKDLRGNLITRNGRLTKTTGYCGNKLPGYAYKYDSIKKQYSILNDTFANGTYTIYIKYKTKSKGAMLVDFRWSGGGAGYIYTNVTTGITTTTGTKYLDGTVFTNNTAAYDGNVHEFVAKGITVNCRAPYVNCSVDITAFGNSTFYEIRIYSGSLTPAQLANPLRYYVFWPSGIWDITGNNLRAENMQYLRQDRALDSTACISGDWYNPANDYGYSRFVESEELVTNGKFNNDISGWTAGANNVIAWQNNAISLKSGTVAKGGAITGTLRRSIPRRSIVNVRFRIDSIRHIEVSLQIRPTNSFNNGTLNYTYFLNKTNYFIQFPRITDGNTYLRNQIFFYFYNDFVDTLSYLRLDDISVKVYYKDPIPPNINHLGFDIFGNPVCHMAKHNYQDIKPIFLWTDDDGTKECYTVLKPLLDAYGYVGNAAIITGTGIPDASNSLMTKTQIRSLINAGWGIMSHSVTHNVPYIKDLPDSQALYEIVRSKQIIDSTFNLNISCFTHPYGACSTHEITLIKPYYRIALGIYVINYINWPQNMYYVLRYGIDGASLATLQSVVDDAISNSKIVIFYSHAVNWNAAQIVIINQILAYMKSKGIVLWNIEDLTNYLYEMNPDYYFN